MTTWAPNQNEKSDHAAARVAMAVCFAMIAYHVGSKAVRDAFFLREFDVTALPKMVAAASLFSIVAVLGAARVISRYSPARVAPPAFLFSALLHAAVWAAAPTSPRAAAVALYLLSIAVGAILTSAFWSMLNERFDPRSAKTLVGSVAGAGTVGGMIGGLLTERMASAFPLTAMLPVLALYHLISGILLFGLRAPGSASQPPREQPKASAMGVLTQTPYLKTLAALVVLGTISASMIDYVFKAAALTEYGRGESLMRFFAVYYTATAVVTFLLQTAGSKPLLATFGTARTIATLPLATTVGGVLAILNPGLMAATIARGLEAVFRGSLFRAGYEIFYMPMPVHEKRSAKAVIDVAFDRLGDALGSAFVSLLIALGVTAVSPPVLIGAVLAGLAGLYVASLLHGAYLDALEHGLRDRTEEVVAAASDESLSLSSFGGVSELASRWDLTRPTRPGGDATGGSTTSAVAVSAMIPASVPAVPAPIAVAADPIVEQTAILRSTDRRAIRRLMPDAATHPELIPHLIHLLANDDLSQSIMRAFRPVAERHAGQLLDSLLDQDNTDFAVRRRIPRLLASVPRQLVADGLLRSLNDRRFEVRFQAGLALAAIASSNRLLRFSPEEIFGYIQKEVAVSKPVWDSHRLLDAPEEGSGDEDSQIFDAFLRTRTSRGLQHLFTLLSLVFPPEPLKLALQSLQLDDPHLRGTALEYLSSVLPRDVRDRLWPLIDTYEGQPPARLDGSNRDQALAELMRADQSIYLRIEELRKRERG